jgi:hypothetical protein
MRIIPLTNLKDWLPTVAPDFLIEITKKLYHNEDVKLNTKYIRIKTNQVPVKNGT